MRQKVFPLWIVVVLGGAAAAVLTVSRAEDGAGSKPAVQDAPVLIPKPAIPQPSAVSYQPVALKETFDVIFKRMSAEKPAVMKRQMALLEERYDLSDRPVKGVTMTRGKPIQEGVRVKLPAGMTWQKLAAMSPEEIKAGGHFPAGFVPLPHVNHP